MKRILCFGDSNTWGYIPSSETERYDDTIRYPKVLQNLLGNAYEVIEEGLPGRTVGVDNIKELIGNRNGILSFAQTVYTHLPLDYILILLGTNDMKLSYHRTPKECADDLRKYYLEPIKAKLGGKIKNNPQIIIVAPTLIVGGYDEFLDAEIRTSFFNEEYRKVAEEYDALFIDNEGLINGSDHIHFTKETHLYLASKIAKTILKENK